MEGMFSPLHLLLIFGIAFVMIWPVARILERAGFNRAWCLLMFFPLLNWIAVWIFAYSKWPALHRSSATAGQSETTGI